ncbi:hypothetical protein ACILDT_10860 [Capnocytophaga canis]|uniref:hypothetical protein n=1 Tax=Capnocytophaga canis TaxID=1848903 RepID=UPI00156222B2|nr:hypothetical protein [Capnocytophaga canis]
MGIFISIFTDKVGVGQSTLTLLVANNLKYKYGKKVCIVDATRDKKLYNKRKEEEKKYHSIEVLKKEPPIEIFRVEDYQEWTDFEEKQNYDFLFLDIEQSDDFQIDFLLETHHLFIISENNKKEENFDISLYSLFKNIRLSNIPLQNVMMVFNKSQFGEKKEEVSRFKDLGVDVLLPAVNNQSSYNNVSTFVKETKGSVGVLSDEIYRLLVDDEYVTLL